MWTHIGKDKSQDSTNKLLASFFSPGMRNALSIVVRALGRVVTAAWAITRLKKIIPVFLCPFLG